MHTSLSLPHVHIHEDRRKWQNNLKLLVRRLGVGVQSRVVARVFEQRITVKASTTYVQAVLRRKAMREANSESQMGFAGGYESCFTVHMLYQPAGTLKYCSIAILKI